MPEPTLLEIMAALADQIRMALGGGNGATIPGLQVEPNLLFNPTPPCIDVYPADPFTEQTSYGLQNQEVFFAVRARVTTADTTEGQELLLDMMDVASPYSVAAAIADDRTLGGAVADLEVQPSTGFTIYTGAAGGEGGKNLLGCEWRTRIVR